MSRIHVCDGVICCVAAPSRAVGAKDSGYNLEYKSINSSTNKNKSVKDVAVNMPNFAFKTGSSLLANMKKTTDVDLSMYKEGLRVVHKKFGHGLILKVEKEGEDLKLDIQFEKSGHKRLMAKFANLEII